MLPNMPASAYVTLTEALAMHIHAIAYMERSPLVIIQSQGTGYTAPFPMAQGIFLSPFLLLTCLAKNVLEDLTQKLPTTQDSGVEDGFCNFAASACEQAMLGCAAGSSAYGDYKQPQQTRGLQPELFFKMSHEIYNYGEGIRGHGRLSSNLVLRQLL
uniref:Uncharacterized protein n=1 Tax=Ananas comosus var. bracteatus TaxID=296719 RepID=A0A6V7NTJ6_ANACO|nr:unnamed protein product [Ananas comosus var. bracteatus]